MVYVDIRKAFDSVVYSKLLHKIVNFEIEGNLLEWVSNYFLNRYQCIDISVSVINGSCSSMCEVISGVPQGSVLGPLFFLLFINDLPQFLISKHSLQYSPIKLFANDAELCHTVNCISDALFLQSLLNSLHEWCETWQLSINSDKCQVQVSSWSF